MEKDSEILLDLQKKIDALFGAIRTLDLNIKIISNKLNGLNSNANGAAIVQKQSTIELPQETEHISSEFQIKVEDKPIAFPRTSRQETYNSIPMAQTIIEPNKIEDATVKIPDQAFSDHKDSEIELNKNSIPVTQRVLDKNGKAVFLASVTINDVSTGKTVAKCKTSGTGKWMASLHIGCFKIFVVKIESLNKMKQEEIQEILVTGEKVPFELPNLIMQ